LTILGRQDSWLNMLHDRNMTSHLYQEALVLEIAQRVVDRYLLLLDDAYRECG
jgi:hypothetical protein